MNARDGSLAVVLATVFGCGGNDDGRNEATSVTTIATTLGTGPSDTSGSTGASTTASSTTASSTTSDETQGEGPSFDVAGADTTAGDCVPTAADETVCDGVDDDCNGFVDDIDVGGDGICDCLVIAIIGNAGPNPSSQFVTWLTMQGTSSARIDPALVDDMVLAPYDIIILDSLTRSYTAAEATAFSDWVDAGGGLMSMTGHTGSPAVDQDRPNVILGEFAIAYTGGLLDGPVTDFLPHPITMGLTSVTFAGGFQVAETMANATDVVAQLPAAPIARAREFGDGKVFVWGDEWIEYDSEWSTMPEIHQLWVNVFDWLRPADLCAPPPG